MLSVDNHELELDALDVFVAKYPWSLPKSRRGRNCSTFNLIWADYRCHDDDLSGGTSAIFP
jgi:hypothetical protein